MPDLQPPRAAEPPASGGARSRPGRRRPRRHRDEGWIVPGDGPVMVAGSVAMILVLGGFWLLATRTSPETWVPLLVVVFILCVTLPIIGAVTRGPGQRRLRWLLIAALVLKLVAALGRCYVNEVTYEGEADASHYDVAGKAFVDNVRQGHWSMDGTYLEGYPPETRFVGYVTGVFYLVVGPTYLGGYLAFSWVCWLGLLFFLQAFRLSFPNAPPVPTAVLLFFLPSMLFWPSSIGKDALMVLLLGAMTYGLARIMAGRSRAVGVALAAVAGYLIVSIRPHLLMVVLVGFAVSLVARNAAASRMRGAVLTRVAILVLLVPLLFTGLDRLESSLGTGDDGVRGALDRTEQQTSIGRSSFEARPVTNPIDLPISTISVLYRPFLFEARGTALIAGLEGTLLLALTVVAAPWLWRIGPVAYRNQFAAYCCGYALAFVFAFSNIGNAGILARQRVQLFPVVILLAMAAREHRRAHLESLPSQAVHDDEPAAPAPAPSPFHEVVVRP